MKRIGLGCLVLVLLALVVALCFDVLDDEQEIEIEESRIEVVEPAPRA